MAEEQGIGSSKHPAHGLILILIDSGFGMASLSNSQIVTQTASLGSNSRTTTVRQFGEVNDFRIKLCPEYWCQDILRKTSFIAVSSAASLKGLMSTVAFTRWKKNSIAGLFWC